MQVTLKRPFFGPGGVLYPKGTVEYDGPEKELPRDAVVVGKVVEKAPEPEGAADPFDGTTVAKPKK